MNRWWEGNYPYVAGVLAFALALVFRPALNLGSVLGTAVTIAAIWMGFLGTMAGILMAMESRFIVFLKRVDKFGVILDYIWFAVAWSFLFLLLSLAIQLLRLDHWSLTAAWLSLGTVALLATYRALDTTITVIRIEARRDNSDD